jgi:hypothetical protein
MFSRSSLSSLRALACPAFHPYKAHTLLVEDMDFPNISEDWIFVMAATKEHKAKQLEAKQLEAQEEERRYKYEELLSLLG